MLLPVRVAIERRSQLRVCAVRDSRSLTLNTVAAAIVSHFTCNSNCTLLGSGGIGRRSESLRRQS